jgi:hypothetical protein
MPTDTTAAKKRSCAVCRVSIEGRRTGAVYCGRRCKNFALRTSRRQKTGQGEWYSVRFKVTSVAHERICQACSEGNHQHRSPIGCLELVRGGYGCACGTYRPLWWRDFNVESESLVTVEEAE